MTVRELVNLASIDTKVLTYRVVLVTHTTKTYQDARRARIDHEMQTIYIEG